MKPRGLLLALMAVLTVCLSTRAANDEWKPIDPGEVSLKAPIVEKGADAEGLFWEVRIDDGTRDLILNHYIRIKVFTERGRETQSKIDIPFGNFFGQVDIKEIAGRTIKPDGTVVELKKEDVFERTIVSVSGAKMKVKSFAMPAVEPGCIIEYRWREVRLYADAHYVRLQFQRSIPVQRVDYYIRPMNLGYLGMTSITFNGESTYFVKDKDGFSKASMTNVPALVEEPRMPPESQIKTWMLVFYSGRERPDPTKFWKDLGKGYYAASKSLIKPNDEIKRQASLLTADAKTSEQKLEKLFEFCRTKITNINSDAAGLTPDAEKKVKENKNPGDTLKRAIGTGADVNYLFASLATAAGFEVRQVVLPDRGDIFFDEDMKKFPNPYFLRSSNIAINVDGNWKYFSPGYNYLPFEMLRWQEEGVPGLVTDPNEPFWVQTPSSPPDKSKVTRRGKFRLADNGTLEGDVTVQYTGHPAVERKQENDASSETQREDTLKEEVKRQMSAAEISNIKIENVTDPLKPLIYSYHVNFPSYAQKTGRRLFLQPAFFQLGLGPMFSRSQRKYPIYFHYAWSEDDRVEIELPAGFLPENVESPAPVGSGPISDYKPSLALTTDKKTLVYKRSFFFGANDALLFPIAGYDQLKGYFDALNKRDNYTVALRQSASN